MHTNLYHLICASHDAIPTQHHCSITILSVYDVQEVDRIVGEIFARYEHQWMSACRLEEEAATLPAIASTLNDMVQLISE